MDFDELIRLTKIHLGPDADKSGAMLYSSLATLRRGIHYLMGLNPGGDPETERETVLQSLEKVGNESPGYSAYCDEEWAKQGKAPHQKRVIEICSLMGEDVRNVFAANAIFVRSHNASNLRERYDELKLKCLELHKVFLSIVQPKVILCLGNGPVSSFAIMREWLRKEVRICDGGSTFRDGKYFKTEINLHFPATTVKWESVIVGIPHPSRFKPSDALCKFLKKLR